MFSRGCYLFIYLFFERVFSTRCFEEGVVIGCSWGCSQEGVTKGRFVAKRRGVL